MKTNQEANEELLNHIAEMILTGLIALCDLVCWCLLRIINLLQPLYDWLEKKSREHSP